MKTIKAILLPLIVVSVVLIQPGVASARPMRHHRHHGDGLGVGLVIGSVVGIIAGAAIASSASSGSQQTNVYYGPGPNCRRVVRVCRDYYGPYGEHETRCFRRVRWVC